METKTQIGRDITYFHDRLDDKHYFGGFLNLAKNNIEQVVDEFRLRLGLPEPIDKEARTSEIIANYFTEKKSYTDWERGMNILKEYLPVVEYLDLPATDNEFENVPNNEKENAKRKYFTKNWFALNKTINTLRNFYTHHYHPPVNIDDDVAKFLDKNLLNVCLEIKKRKMKTDKTKQALKLGIDEQLAKLKELKSQELKKKGIKGWSNVENVEGAVYNDAFIHMIFKNENGNSELKDKYKTKRIQDKYNGDLQTDFSISSLVFLLSMFLSKKEIEQFKSNLFGFKGKVIKENEEYEISKTNNSLKFMATHWVFSYLAFKGLKQRVKNTFDKETLLMQMVDELNKVPHEVYQTLSKEKQDEFLEDINEYIQDNEENKKSLEESTVVHPIIRKRYESKFNYFAVRFLDEFANFPNLKFTVYAGNYVHHKKEKEIAGGKFVSERMIKEKINVFGKLSEVSKYKSDYFSEETDEETINWELFPNPSYLFIQENIPVFIDMFKKSEEAKQCQANINRAKDKINPKQKRKSRLTKKEIIDIIYAKNKDIGFGDPTALLSAKELPALLFELLVNKKTGEELENIIVEKIVSQCNNISSYNGDSLLTGSQITKNLLKSHPTDEVDNFTKIYSAIEREMQITDGKLHTIKDNRKEELEGRRNKNPRIKVRKHVFYSKELGQEATWLANDIKRFMPESARQNWKGFHHSELQKFLAFFDRNKSDALELISEFWDLNSDIFIGKELKKAFLKDQFDQFYESYLNSRNETLTGLKNSIENFEEEPKLLKKVMKDFYRIFYKRLYVVKSANDQKLQLLAKPICLPHGIFDKKPTFVKGTKVEDNPSLFAAWYSYTYNNTHRFQEFYNMPRDYKDLYERYKEKDTERHRNKKSISEAVAFSVFKLNEDLRIKKIKSQDLFVKLMVDHLFKSIFNQEIEMDLKELYQTSDERYKIQVEADKQKNREKGDHSDNKLNENFIWNKTIPISICNGQIQEPQVKIKDIGKFRKLESDAKVLQLLGYDRSRVWSKLEIEDEMENKPGSYERIRREKLLKEIQGFEKQILEKEQFDGQNHPRSFEYNEYPNFRMYVINGVLRKLSDVKAVEIDKLIDSTDDISIEAIASTDEEIQLAYLLILMRNKFGHNQFPSTEAFELLNTFYPKTVDETYSEYFYRCCQEIIARYN